MPESLEAADKDDLVATLRTDMRRAAAAETRRIADIRNICDGQYADIEAQAIDEGWDVTRCELAVLRESRPSAPATQVVDSTPKTEVLEAVANVRVRRKFKCARGPLRRKNTGSGR